MSKTGAVLGLLLSTLGLATGLPGPAEAEKRVALLVGNNGYENVPRLNRAINDAHALGEALKKLGFKVFVAEDQPRRSMSEAFLAFDRAIEFGDTALFFFAEPMVSEIHGQNYLLPTDVPAATEGQEELVRDASFAVERIVDRLQARGRPHRDPGPRTPAATTRLIDWARAPSREPAASPPSPHPKGVRGVFRRRKTDGARSAAQSN